MEYEDDLVGAEAVYAEVARTSENKLWEGLANYRLGLIYQFDYDDLDEAKRYYDKAVESFPRRSATEATDASNVLPISASWRRSPALLWTRAPRPK